jgi:hypothetical protein
VVELVRSLERELAMQDHILAVGDAHHLVEVLLDRQIREQMRSKRIAAFCLGRPSIGVTDRGLQRGDTVEKLFVRYFYPRFAQ